MSNCGCRSLAHTSPSCKCPSLRSLNAALFLLALGLALVGSNELHGVPGYANSTEADLAEGAPWMTLAFGVWLLGELNLRRTALQTGWNALDNADKRRWLCRLPAALFLLRGCSLLVGAMSSTSALPFLAEASLWSLAALVTWLLNEFAYRRGLAPLPSTPGFILPRDPNSLPPAIASYARRLPTLVLAVLASTVVWENTANNSTQPVYIALWFASALLWSLFFAPHGFHVMQALVTVIDRARRFSLRKHWRVALVFVLIMLLGRAIPSSSVGYAAPGNDVQRP